MTTVLRKCAECGLFGEDLETCERCGARVHHDHLRDCGSCRRSMCASCFGGARYCRNCQLSLLEHPS
jgi:hypothetical protein